MAAIEGGSGLLATKAEVSVSPKARDNLPLAYWGLEEDIRGLCHGRAPDRCGSAREMAGGQNSLQGPSGQDTGLAD